MKILLIQPPWYGFQNIVSNRLYLGLAYLGAVLEKAGHEVKIFNGETFFCNLTGEGEKLTINEKSYRDNFSDKHEVYDLIIDEVKKFAPEIVGISFMTANSASAYILANRLKKYCQNLPLIAGGIHATLVPEEPLSKNVFDYVVRGEGENTILELVTAIAHKTILESILGLSFKQNGKIIHSPDRPMIENLDKLPFPAFHLMHNYTHNLYSCSGIISSRGCPFACSYCASKLIWTRKTRFRTPENIVAEIIERHNKLGISSFSFHDDTFILRTNYVKKFCELVLNLDFKIRWDCNTRGDTLDFDLLKLMKRAGCDHIYLGLESGSPKIQEMIKKNLSTEKVRTATQLARRAGVTTTVYFMVGFPEETENDIWQSIKTMKLIKPDYAIWGILTPYPGTEIWQLAVNQKLIDVDNINWQNFFHHYNQGNLFKSMPDESWSKMLNIIHTEQEEINNRLTIIKFKKKMLNKYYLLRLGLKDPMKVLNYFKKYLKFQKMPYTETHKRKLVG